MKRTRASKPKARSGCRTCKERRVKCDETRPSCRRCIAANRYCGGYAADVIVPRRPALLLPKPLAPLADSIQLTSPGWDLDAEFFYRYTVTVLPGSDLEFPWCSIIRAGAREPTVLYAVTALASLHRVITDQPLNEHTQLSVFTRPLEIYHKAVNGLRRYIDRTEELGVTTVRENTLTAVLLLYCFEVLYGQDTSATRHLKAAFAMFFASPKEGTGVKPKISPASSEQKRYPEPTTLVLSTRNADRLDLLTQLFMRLASDWVASGPSYYGGEQTPLLVACKDTLPEEFTSLQEASVYLNVLDSESSESYRQLFDCAEDYVARYRQEIDAHECARDCLVGAMTRVMSVENLPGFDTKLQRSISSMKAWRSSFNSWKTRLHASGELQRYRKAILSLELQYFQTWIMTVTGRAKDEMFFDRFESEFEGALALAEELLQLQRGTTATQDDAPDRAVHRLSSLGNNVASGISMIVEKCRNGNIRRRGINLLRSLDFRGVFDTDYFVSFLEHIVNEEERLTRLITSDRKPDQLDCCDIPEEARYAEAFICGECVLDGRKEEFYKGSQGFMVYVPNFGGCGELTVQREYFRVDRKHDVPGLVTNFGDQLVLDLC